METTKQTNKQRNECLEYIRHRDKKILGVFFFLIFITAFILDALFFSGLSNTNNDIFEKISESNPYYIFSVLSMAITLFSFLIYVFLRLFAWVMDG